MSKSFIVSIKIIIIFTTIVHCILVILILPNLLFGLGMGGGNLSNQESVKLLLSLLFFLFVLYVPVKMWRSQENKTIITFFILYIIIVACFHIGLVKSADSQEIRNQKAVKENEIKRQIFLKEHCIPIDADAYRPVYRCDDGTIH